MNTVRPLAATLVLACLVSACSSSRSDNNIPSHSTSSSTETDSSNDEVLRPHSRSNGDGGSSVADEGNDSSPGDSGATERNLLRERPYVLGVPSSISAPNKAPLVLFLHGYGASGPRLQDVLEVPRVAERERFIYAIPQGTRSALGRRFWNATPACCDFQHRGVDDVSYLAAVIADSQRRAPVDPERIYVFGFSNGGFMAHRLACELSGTITAIVSIAGMSFLDRSRCSPEGSVGVIQVHGDADEIVSYGGGHTLGRAVLPRHPSAVDSINRWVQTNGCSLEVPQRETIDLEPRIPGAETTITTYRGCRERGVELWTVAGGSHFVGLRPEAMATLFRALPRVSGNAAR